MPAGVHGELGRTGAPGDHANTALAAPPLTDQYGRAVDLAAWHGQVVVAIVVSARQLRRVKAWERAIIARSQRSTPLSSDAATVPKVLRIADFSLGNAPPDLATITKRLQRMVPPDRAIGIDLGGLWRRHFALDLARPSILLISAHGELVARAGGYFRADAAQAVLGELDQLLAALPGATDPAAASSQPTAAAGP